MLRLQASVGNSATARLIARSAGGAATLTVSRDASVDYADDRNGGMTPVPRRLTASHQVTQLAQMAVDELDGAQSKKVLLATIINAERLGELPAYLAILKSYGHGEYANYFNYLVSKVQAGFGSQLTVSILEQFADAGVHISRQVSGDLTPLASVAEIKSVMRRFNTLLTSGDLARSDIAALNQLLSTASSAIRRIETHQGPHLPQVRQMNVAGVAGSLWATAGALAADDVTVIGIADDVAIPFVVIAAAALSAYALLKNSTAEVLNYEPAREAVQAALREMTDLLAVSSAMAVQGAQAAGQVGHLAEHLARILGVAAVGGVPSGEPPKKNDRDDEHWWTEIKAAVKNFMQATKRGSLKQIMRELAKRGFGQKEMAEIEAMLKKAGEMMGEDLGPLLPPP